MLRVFVNDQPHTVPAGGSVLDLLHRLGIPIPTLCHDPRLRDAGVCRLCLVSIEGLTHRVTACTTPLVNGMRITTATPELEDARRAVLEMLARRHPAAAGGDDTEFMRVLRACGLEAEIGQVEDTPPAVDRSHPYITVDMSRCIDCYRCVRICDELQGERVWHVRDRGRATRIVPDADTLADSSCVSCGACVDTCPTGALSDAAAIDLGPALAWTRTTCPYCGVGCEMTVGSRDGQIVSVRPVLDAPVNKGHLCVKGRYAFGFVAAADRVLEPMIRTAGGEWRTASWDEAIAVVAERLQSIAAAHGPESVGILGSARATNEDNYVVQKLARVAIGTNNVDCCARVCHAPSAAGLKSTLGTGLATNAFDDIERARTLLVVGANPTEDHPVVGARIRQAARHGARLIVVDPRRIDLVDGTLSTDSLCHLAIRPGTNIPLLNSMAHVIVEERLGDATFVRDRVSGADEFSAFVEAWTPERAASICGVDADEIRRAARMYAAPGPSMSVHGLGLTEHVQGTDGVRALVNLALLTGNIGRPGAGVNPLRGQNNVQGAAHMGCDPALLPGSTPLDAGRARAESIWGRPLPTTAGLTLIGMLDAAAAGRLKAMWFVGYVVALTHSNASETARALAALEFVVVQDLFLTETARQVGSVFLPACSSFEKDGTFMNGERRIQRVRAAIPPVGQSRADWRIVCDVAAKMGAPGFAFAGPEAIWNEVRDLCEGARGMSYARLDASGVQWPCPSLDHPGTPLLHAREFAIGPRATLQRIDYRPTPETTTAEFPLLLTTGRTLYQFNAGTMTGRTRNNDLRPTDLLDMSPGDAEPLGLRDGDPVRVTSRYGSAVLPLRINTGMRPGELFATFHTVPVFLNRVTGPHRDAVTGTPEYKVAAVRIERGPG